MNLATVDVHGCDSITANGDLYLFIYRYEFSIGGGISYRRGLWRCLFGRIGQCEGLSSWDRRQAVPTLFYARRTDVKPAGSGTYSNNVCQNIQRVLSLD